MDKELFSNSILTRIDLQLAFEDEKKTVLEWREFIAKEMHEHNKLSDTEFIEEFEKIERMKLTQIEMQKHLNETINSILEYAEIFEYGFQIDGEKKGILK